MMDDKIKRRRFIFSFGIFMTICRGLLLLIPYYLFTGTMPFLETPVPFVPGNPTATPLGSDITDPDFIKGVEAFYNRNDEETIALMTKVINANPNLAPPYRYRGGSLGSLGDCEGGLADAEKAISLNKDYAAAWAIRGLMHACLGDDEQKMKDYQKALSLDPSLAFVHHNLGVDYYQQGDYEKSLEEYGISALIDPTRSGAWAGMAQALSQLGKYDECIIRASRAIKIKREEWLAYFIRGVCYDRKGDSWEAILDYKTYLEHDPQDAQAWYNLGTAQYHYSLAQDAVDSLSKALELDPANYPANINRGWAYIELKKYNEALRDFNFALDSGDIPAAYSGRGNAYYFLERYDEAIADLELVRSLLPDRPNSYCILALSYFEVGRYQDSVDSAVTANRLDPQCGGPRLLEYQARSYYALGNYEQAVLYIDQAVAIGPSIKGVYYQGIIYDDAGKDEQAILILEQFLDHVNYATDKSIFDADVIDAKQRLEKLKP